MGPASRSHMWATRLVRLTAALVPAGQRDDWRSEWLAELAAHTRQPDARRSSPLRRALGAPVDALWLRQRQLLDWRALDDLRHGWRAPRMHPSLSQAALAAKL